MTKCGECGAADVVREKRDMPYTYKGRKTVLKDILAEWCPACGEGLFGADAEDGEDMAVAVCAFKQLVNAEVVNADYVTTVRKKLG